MRSRDHEKNWVISSYNCKSRREPGHHLAQYSHFIDEETKAQRIQFLFSRTLNYSVNQSKLGPAKNRVLNTIYFRSVTLALASTPWYVLNASYRKMGSVPFTESRLSSPSLTSLSGSNWAHRVI